MTQGSQEEDSKFFRKTECLTLDVETEVPVGETNRAESQANGVMCVELKIEICCCCCC